MYNRLLVSFLVLLFCVGCAGQTETKIRTLATTHRSVAIASNGTPQVPIVLVEHPTAAEQQAAEELRDYLKKITGGTFPIIAESAYTSGNSIQVGNTAKARAKGIDGAAFAAEQWQVKVTGGNLYLNGGRPGGTLYAVYHFLEEQCGVRWWGPGEETCPVNANLDLAESATAGKPTIPIRDIYWWDPVTAAHNRLNVYAGKALISGNGESITYAMAAVKDDLGNNVHCNGTYINPDSYFAAHPEWFSADESGTRQNNGQLCLTNPAMRRQYLANLLANIAKCKKTAAKAGTPAPKFYDVSQNDNERYCRCAACTAIAQAEGAQSGPILDFANWLADQVAAKHPEVTLSVLAYMYSEEPPATLKPRNNLAIRLCDTVSNYLQPITHPDNAVFKRKLDLWSDKAGTAGIHIWKYAKTYDFFGSFPTPNLRAMHEDFAYYAKHQVKSIVAEHEYAPTTDMWVYKNWLIAKLMENPAVDFDALQAKFCNGYFGAGGAQLIAYLKLMETHALATRSSCHWQTAPEHVPHLNQAFYDQAQKCFDAALAAAIDNATAVRRIKLARLPLDRSQVRLISLGLVKGDKATLAARYRAAWHEQVEQYAGKANWPQAKFQADADCDRQTQSATYVPPPVGVPGVKPGDVVLDQHAAGSPQSYATIVHDPEASSGITTKWLLQDKEAGKYAMPMPLGLYSKSGRIDRQIAVRDLPGPGYHWYKIGTGPIHADSTIWATWLWQMGVRVCELYDKHHPTQTYEVWVNLKFEGPRFGLAGRPNAVYLERAVLVKRAPADDRKQPAGGEASSPANPLSPSKPVRKDP